MCGFRECYDCRQRHLLCDLPRMLGWYVVELVLGHPLSFICLLAYEYKYLKQFLYFSHCLVCLATELSLLFTLCSLAPHSNF